MARNVPNLPAQANARAVAAVNKLPPLHPPYEAGLGNSGVRLNPPMGPAPSPVLSQLNNAPGLVDNYPLD